MKKTPWMLLGVLALGLSAMGSPAVAQDNYPSSPVKLMLGFGPGAITDTVARMLAQKLSAQMNTSIVVENKPGANGNIATELVAKARPDGYTLLFNTIGVVMTRAMGSKLNYDVFQDLAPVALVASGPLVLCVHPSVPANNPVEFIAHLRANPNKLAYSSSGVGAITHLTPLLFLQANGLSALHVPYKGSGAAVIDAIAGRVQFGWVNMITALPPVRDKRLKAIAISGLTRSPLLPDVPSLNESVMPGFAVGGWYGVMAPAKTPTAIVTRLNGEIMKALDRDLKSRLDQQGVEPLGSTPEQYGAYLKSEFERWTKVIKSSGIKPE